MKKIYLFFTLLMSVASFGQPIITMIADGDETGGTPKVLEIYAKGTVDFTQYSLQNQTNSNTIWGSDFDLSPLGTKTDEFVYVYKDGMIGTNSDQSAFGVNFPSVDAQHALDTGNASILNINGDDRVRIIETATGTPVDTYGVDQQDGTGTAWEYKDGYAKRLNGTGPDPVFVEANWEFHNGELNNYGAVQDGTTYESIIGIGTYVPAAVSNPSLAITAPTNGQVFSPETTDVSVEFVIQNFTVAQSGGDGHIHWRLDGGSWNMKYDVTPIQLSGLSAGSHTVDMKLVDDSHNDLNPPVEATVSFSIASYTQVATLADLRAGTLGDYYHFTGEAFVTAGITYNSGAMKGWFQDATAGMMAYVPSGMTQNQPNEGDGITDVKGKLIDYNGVLEIELTADFTMTGNNSVQAPQVVTIADYNANHDDYESELIKFENVTIDGNGDTTFQSSSNYNVTDGTDTVVLRTNFYDLVGETIPTTAVNITGVGAEYNGTAQIFPRDINDIEAAQAIGENNIPGLEVYPNPVINKQVFINSDNNSAKQVMIYDILGKVVLTTEVNNAQAINVGTLKAGIYMMKIVENNHVALQKLIIK
jgi:hypothetical protein